MKSTGIVRLVDELGRIVLPIELRRALELNEGEAVEFFVNDAERRIMLRKYRIQACLFCQSTEALSYFRERFVCAGCLRELHAGGSSERPDGESPPTDEPPADRADAGALPGVKPSRRKGKRGETFTRLAEVMKSYPHVSQSEWARMIGVTQSRVSQLLRSLQ